MTKGLHKVTIIIPAKNEESRLPACMDAISRLDYDPGLFETIVVDNGSSDSTVEIAKKYNCRVYSLAHVNVSGLRNFGARQATGDILCFVDADVIVDPAWIASALPHFDHQDNGCVTGLIKIPADSTWVERTWALNRKTEQDVFITNWSSSMNMIIPSTLFKRLGGFSESMTTGEDVELSERIKKSGLKIIYDKKVCVTHIGEAKTLRQLIKKERWRGYSDLDLLVDGGIRLSNLRHATQPIFFISSCVFFMFAVIMKSLFLTGLALSCVLLLPFLKTAVVSNKQKTARYSLSLFIVWTAYYIARSIAIFDNIKGKLCKRETTTKKYKNTIL